MKDNHNSVGVVLLEVLQMFRFQKQVLQVLTLGLDLRHLNLLMWYLLRLDMLAICSAIMSFILFSTIVVIASPIVAALVAYSSKMTSGTGTK